MDATHNGNWLSFAIVNASYSVECVVKGVTCTLRYILPVPRVKTSESCGEKENQGING